MKKAKIVQFTRIFNFDINNNSKLIFRPDLYIEQAYPDDVDTVMKGPIMYNMWPNFVLKKEYSYQQSGKIINESKFSECIRKTLNDFNNVLLALRLFRKSAIFFDYEIRTECYIDDIKTDGSTNFFEEAHNRIHGDGLVIDPKEFDPIISLFKKISLCTDNNVTLAIYRFSFGMSKVYYPDKLIDYIIGLEALYTGGEELSFRLSLTLSFLLGKTNIEKKEIFKFMRKMYKARNDIMHSNKKKVELTGQDMDKLEYYLKESILLSLKDLKSFDMKALENLFFK